MIHITMSFDRIDRVLQQARYVPHVTRDDNNNKVLGYIKEINIFSRWHAIANGNGIEIHCDKTVNGYHRVVSYHRKEKIERQRICNVYKELYPKDKTMSDITKMNVPKKGEFAPNLMELQRRHKTPIYSHKNPFLLIATKIKEIVMGVDKSD